MSDERSSRGIIRTLVRSAGWFLLALGITFVIAGLLLNPPHPHPSKVETGLIIVIGLVLGAVGLTLQARTPPGAR